MKPVNFLLGFLILHSIGCVQSSPQAAAEKREVITTADLRPSATKELRGQDPGESSLLPRFRELIGSRHFHSACLLIPQIQREMQHVPEGAAGYEYSHLVASAAAVGQAEWNEILLDPRISLALKIDLVREIDESARK
jgi:hypothetical protein